MFSIDCESSGLDLKHGARPYLVTTCDDQGKQTWWEWQVNPYNREPIIPEKDITAIKELLHVCGRWSKFDEETREYHTVITQNGKFDAHALDTIGICNFPWEMNHDTLTIAHVLGSNQRKGLDDLASTWLLENIKPVEDRMKEAVTECRRKVQQARLKVKRWRKKGQGITEETLFKEEPLAFWAIAEEGQEGMPSAKGSSNKKPEEQLWKNDAWLPRAMAFHMNLPKDHHYWSVTRDYANTDSATTMLLWPILKKECQRQGLWKHYLEMRKLNGIIKDMEDVGVTYNKSRASELRAEYEETCRKCEVICVSLSEGRLKELPAGPRSNALQEIVFEVLNLKSSRLTKTGNDSMDKYQLEDWVQTLPSNSKGRLFVANLQKFRKRKTALGYIDAYERFAIDEDKELVQLRRAAKENPDDEALKDALRDREQEGSCTHYARLYPSLNATGTDTLRMSQQNPNLQQVSKQEIEEEGHKTNARYMFGPVPGREWWKADYENLELKIPGYESGEEAMISLFEKPKDPPYFGSYHLLNASIAYPDLFHEKVCPDCVGIGRRLKDSEPCTCTRPKVEMWEVKGGFKERHVATWYQWIKNAGFALIYGCQELKFDQTAHKHGAYKLLRKRLPKLFRLSDYWLNYANQHGYIETLPDKNIDSKHGYRLLTSRSEYGSVSPTVPLNYHVSGTAMWCTRKAMIRCEEQLKEWRSEGFGGYMILQVHDELVFDCPKICDPTTEIERSGKTRTSNLWRARRLQELMCESGDDIGIPLTVALSYCPDSWGEGVAI